MKWRALAATEATFGKGYKNPTAQFYLSVYVAFVLGRGDYSSTYGRLQRPLLSFVGLCPTIDFREKAKASVAFCESTNYATGLLICTQRKPVLDWRIEVPDTS